MRIIVKSYEAATSVQVSGKWFGRFAAISTRCVIGRSSDFNGEQEKLHNHSKVPPLLNVSKQHL